MTLTALQARPSIVDDVYDSLLWAIISGEIQPATRLIQDELAQSLGVSRQPVGQALLLLKAQGFVAEAQGRGLLVAGIEASFVRDLYEIRAALDLVTARRASEAATPKDLERLQSLVSETEEGVGSSDILERTRADMAFHEALYEVSGNTLVAQVLRPYWHHLLRVMCAVKLLDDVRISVLAEHTQILERISDRDADGAAEAARLHVETASRILQSALEERAAVSDAGRGAT